MPARAGVPDRRPPTSFPGAQPGTRRMTHPDIPLPDDRPTTIPSPPPCARPSSPVTRLRPGRPTAIIDALPGKKYLLKGNHDYWWNTAAKMERFFREHELTTMEILHNNCKFYGELALCGTRGWFYELDNQGTHDEKVLLREIGRLETSLKAAGEHEKLVFLHYPPLYQGYRCPEILRLLKEYGVKLCCYGHLHGASHRRAIEGMWDGTEFSLVSADYLKFVPKKICE